MVSLAERKNAHDRLHVAAPAQHGVDQVADLVDRPTQVGPADAGLQLRLADMPAGLTSAPPAMPALADFIAHDRR